MSTPTRVPLAFSALVAATGVDAGEGINAELIGKSGAGYATGDFIESSLINPSLAARFGRTDDVGLLFNASAVGRDESDLVDAFDALQERTDQVGRTPQLSPSLANELDELIRAVEGKSTHATGGASVALAIPNDVLAATAFVREYAEVGGYPEVAQSDYQLLEQSTGGPFDTNDLDSNATARGVLVTETGLALANSFDRGGDTMMIGVTLKHMEVETGYYRARISAFEDEDEFDRDTDTVTETHYDFDAGITYFKGPVRYAFAVHNVVGKRFSTVSSETATLDPSATAAVGFDGGWYNIESAVDVVAAEHYAYQGDVQFARIGAELGQGWISLRMGYKTDMENTLTDTYSVGLGLTVLDSINLDVSARTGRQNTLGGAVQLGLVF